jgi:RNA polymerase sigma-70 factor (ECF subfamily)
MDAQSQDQNEDFLRLYIEHEEALCGFVRSLVITREDAREVIQETAAVLWRKFNELDSPAYFRRWAFGVARFEALSYRRDRARDRHVFGDHLISLLELEAEETSQQDRQEERALQSCLSKLTKRQRTLLEGAYSPGIRIDELAKASGRTPMSLYKTIHRIRTNLAGCIETFLNREEKLE